MATYRVMIQTGDVRKCQSHLPPHLICLLARHVPNLNVAVDPALMLVGAGGGGTTATVHALLHGETGAAERLVLGNRFDRGSLEERVLHTTRDLGTLRRLELGLDLGDKVSLHGVLSVRMRN